MLFEGKTIVVLGATAGLALRCLERSAEQGSNLVLHGRNESRLEAVAGELEKTHSCKVLWTCGDIREPGLASRLWLQATELPGRPFGIACFIGIPGRLQPDEWTPDRLADLFAVNTSGPLLAVRTWAEHMRRDGLPGNAVLLSTMQAEYPFEGSLPYAISKAALGRGIAILAKEFGGPPSIRVNGIAPGVNAAGMALESIERGKYETFLDRNIIPRYGSPDDIAGAFLFLMTPNLYMTGQVLLFDGGLTLRRDL